MKGQQTIFSLSKKKMCRLLLASIAFVAIGFWFVIRPPHISNALLGNPVLIFVAGLASILFFGFIGIFIIRKLRDDSPGIIIDDAGITDNASGVAAGFVLWSDITEIRLNNVAGQNFIMVIVKNPEDYINRQKGFIKRKGMQMNYKTHGSPVSISANSLTCTFAELYGAIVKKYAQINEHNKSI